MRFYRVFNAIYSKSKGDNSELVTVELMKSYSLAFIIQPRQFLYHGVQLLCWTIV